jgi:hypothetical protein
MRFEYANLPFAELILLIINDFEQWNRDDRPVQYLGKEWLLRCITMLKLGRLCYTFRWNANGVVAAGCSS